MANKPVPKKKVAAKKPMSLVERMRNRTRDIDEAAGWAEEPKERKIPLPKKYQ